MNKYFLAILLLLFIIGAIILAKFDDAPNANFEPTEEQIEIIEKENINNLNKSESKEDEKSKQFMRGYWDGYKGKWLGPIKWTLSKEYRQGHLLGSSDKKNKIERFKKEPKEKNSLGSN